MTVHRKCKTNKTQSYRLLILGKCRLETRAERFAVCTICWTQQSQYGNLYKLHMKKKKSNA